MEGNGLLLIGLLRKAKQQWEGGSLASPSVEGTHSAHLRSSTTWLERQGVQLWAWSGCLHLLALPRDLGWKQRFSTKVALCKLCTDSPSWSPVPQECSLQSCPRDTIRDDWRLKPACTVMQNQSFQVLGGSRAIGKRPWWSLAPFWFDHIFAFCSSNPDSRDLPIRGVWWRLILNPWTLKEEAPKWEGEDGQGGTLEINLADCSAIAPGQPFLALGDSKSKNNSPPPQSFPFQEK